MVAAGALGTACSQAWDTLLQVMPLCKPWQLPPNTPEQLNSSTEARKADGASAGRASSLCPGGFSLLPSIASMSSMRLLQLRRAASTRMHKDTGPKIQCYSAASPEQHVLLRTKPTTGKMVKGLQGIELTHLRNWGRKRPPAITSNHPVVTMQ